MGSFDCVGASHSLSPHFAQDEMRLQGANLLSLLRAFGAGRVAEWVDLGVDLAAKVFEDVVGHLGEDIDDLGIELTARPGLNFLTSFGESAGWAIGTIGNDGVEGIGDGEDARP